MTIDALYSLFRRCFPYIIREESTVRAILSHPENVILTRGDAGACVIRGNTILLLAVDPTHRRQGIGSSLLAEAEAHIYGSGHVFSVIGAGEDYLCPGVPCREMPYPEPLFGYDPALLDPRIPENNADFFRHRGYVHSWGECNCFDMAGVVSPLPSPANTQASEGIQIRLALPVDRHAIIACVSAAHEPFVLYYTSPSLYEPNGDACVLIACEGTHIVGCVIVSFTEARDTGSLGCTTVLPSHRGHGVAKQLVFAAVAQLRTRALPRAFLGYTYSGLDKLYGPAGYHPYIFYFMAQRRRPGNGQ